MPTRRRLLICHHSPSPALQAIADAVAEGASAAEFSTVEVVMRPALETGLDDLLGADAIIVGTPANFGYISGALKHMFDQTYRDAREATHGRPFSYWIRGAHDTTGAENAMTAITTGFGWRLATPPLVFIGDVTEERLDEARELGAILAATVVLHDEESTPPE